MIIIDHIIIINIIITITKQDTTTMIKEEEISTGLLVINIEEIILENIIIDNIIRIIEGRLRLIMIITLE